MTRAQIRLFPDPHSPGIDQLVAIVARLRAPGGCPWDREQTHASLRGGLLEEAYEVVAAIDGADDDNLREELGDLLLQTVFHAQIAEEEGRFRFDDVARGIAEKLVRRHPHVFGEDHCADSARCSCVGMKSSAPRKEATRPFSSRRCARLRSPLCCAAEKVQKKAAKVGFDWDAAAPVIAKVREELAEVEAALAARETEVLEGEIGDLLFSVVNLARPLEDRCEVALHRATNKFITRFHAVEEARAGAVIVSRAHEPGRNGRALDGSESARCRGRAVVPAFRCARAAVA
jgi:MazG family protein